MGVLSWNLIGGTGRRSVVRVVQYAVALAVWLVFLYQVARIVRLWKGSYHPLPWHDEWDTLSLLSSIAASPLRVSLWLTPHNEHRLVLPRLVYAADFWAFGGQHLLTFLCIALLVLGTIALLCWPLRRDGLRGPALVGYASGAGCLVANGWQASNFVWAFQVQWFATHFFVTAALASLVAAARPAARQASWFVAAVACAVAANFCTASGNFVWPALLIVTFLLRRTLPRYVPGTALAAALISVGSYFLDLRLSGTGSGSVAMALARPQLAIQFFLTYLGNLLAPFGTRAAVAGGIVMGVGSVWGIWRAWRDHRLATSSSAPMCAGVLTFVVISAAATAIGRLQLGGEAAVESRLASATGLGWAALLILIGTALTDRQRAHADPVDSPASNDWLSLKGAAMIILAAAIGVSGHLYPPYDYMPLVRVKADALTAIVSKVDDQTALRAVGYDGISDERKAEIERFLEQTGRSYRAQPVFALLGRSLHESFPEIHSDCLGAVDSVESLKDTGATAAFRAAGWSWDKRRQAPADQLLLVDEAGKIIGFGERAIDRTDVMTAHGIVTELRTGWIGHGKLEGESFMAFAYSPTGNSVCLVSGKISIPRPSGSDG